MLSSARGAELEVEPLTAIVRFAIFFKAGSDSEALGTFSNLLEGGIVEVSTSGAAAVAILFGRGLGQALL